MAPLHSPLPKDKTVRRLKKQNKHKNFQLFARPAVVIMQRFALWDAGRQIKLSKCPKQT